jgi:NADH dehydrogenase FAD-containing subunit
VCRGRLLGGHTSYARTSLTSILARKRITVYERSEVVSVSRGMLTVRPDGSDDRDGSKSEISTLEFDECLWCTQATATSWLQQAGLPTGGCNVGGRYVCSCACTHLHMLLVPLNGER